MSQSPWTIRRILYGLRRQFGGGPLWIYHATDVITDPQTGEKSNTLTVTEVPDVVILPTKLSREVVRSISAISSNKAFSYGGWFDASVRTLIIDKYDVPDLEAIHQDDWLVIDNKVFEIRRFEDFEHAFVIVGKQVIGAKRSQVIAQTIQHSVTLSEEADGTV